MSFLGLDEKNIIILLIGCFAILIMFNIITIFIAARNSMSKLLLGAIDSFLGMLILNIVRSMQVTNFFTENNMMLINIMCVSVIVSGFINIAYYIFCADVRKIL